MVVKAIFSECSMAFWMDVAKELADNYGWHPCYWTGAASFERHVKARFPDIIFHDNNDAVRGIPPAECSDLGFVAPDQELLKDLAYHETLALKMMDRMDPGEVFSYRERVRLYHRHLGYWLAVLDHFEPDIVVSPCTPHLVYDYILYALCQKRGVRTAMFQYTGLPDLILPVQRFEEGSTALEARYRSLRSQHSSGDVALSPRMQSFLEEGLGPYSGAIPWYTKDAFAKHNRIASVERKLVSFGKSPQSIAPTVKKAIYRLHHPVPPNYYLKQKGKKLEEPSWSNLEWRWHAMKARIRVQRLRSSYAKLVQEEPLHRPYVFVALHYQPENNTSPEGGVFVHQLRMIDLLSKSVPEGWYVYVREHPGQFLTNTKIGQSRTIDLYRDSMSLPNVKLISTLLSPFDLIDSSKAVATITGTVGWQAVVRGKPTLVFGHAWYRDCENVFYTPTRATCKEALLKIAAGYVVDYAKVRLFVRALEDVGIRGYVEPGYARTSGITREENVPAITQAILSVSDLSRGSRPR